MPATWLTSDLSDGFFTKLKDIARRRNFDPEAALAVMLSESGVSPHAIHPSAPASGIFGKMFATRDEALAFTDLSAEDQLDAYDAYMATYTNVPKPKAANLYQLNFLPASILPGQANYRGIDDDAVLASSTGSGYGGQEAGFYRDNSILDYNRDGEITVGDLGAYLEHVQQGQPQKWAELMSRLRETPGDYTPSPRPLPWAAVVMGAAVLATGLFIATTDATSLRRLLPR